MNVTLKDILTKSVLQESSKSEWNYIEKTTSLDDIFGDVTEGGYYIREYGHNMIGYIYPPTESEKLYRAKLSNKTKMDSLGYNVFIELDSAKEFLDDTAVKLAPVTYDEVMAQLTKINTHPNLKMYIDQSSLGNVTVDIEGTLINGDPITFYSSSYIRTQRDIDFIKNQYAKASNEIDCMRKRGYLGVKDESTTNGNNMTEIGKLFEASMSANSTVSETASPAEKELQKLGVNLDKAEKDGSNSYFNATISIDTLKNNGYKRIHTNSDDPTSTAYTNGTWVICLVACTGGYISIYKLGLKAKKIIDAGKEFDVFNNSLDESYKDTVSYISVEYTYNGDNLSDYTGYVRVKTNDEKDALTAARNYAMRKHPEDEPRHFVVTSDVYNNTDVVDSEGNCLTALE